jgi:hypothetical protein
VAKRALTQRSFVLGQPREEFLEAVDLDLSDNSLRKAENVRIKATRTIAERHGTEYVTAVAPFTKAWEIHPQDGVVAALLISKTTLAVLDPATGAVVYGQPISTLTDTEYEHLWVEPFGFETVIGTEDRLQVLRWTGSTYTLTDFAFDAAPGSELAQPYWAFTTGITLTPSAVTGSVTVTASAALFSAAWVGMRIRYLNREILITAFTSATQVTGTVQSQLPPTFQLTLSTTTGFKVGDTVVGQTTDYRGYIIAVAATTIDVLTIDFFDGPDAAEKISAPSGTATLTSKAVISPGASPIWDEPLISPVRGYPRSGASAAGRLVLCDFAAAPDVIALSSSRSIMDFRVGDEDDDAIARAIGDNRPRLLHVVNVGDMIILADRGLYLISLRDGTILSPATFAPTSFDARGSTGARPAKVDDGVVFVEAGGSAIAVARLTGEVYKKWAVRTLSTFHDHLFTGPIALCGPPANCILDDKYLFVANGDGTLVAMSWTDNFDMDNVGFVKWTSPNCAWIWIAPIAGQYFLIGTRSFAVTLERLSATAMMDCEQSATAAIPSGFNGQVMHVAGEGWYAGTRTITGGAVPDVADVPAGARVGFNFVARAQAWPKKLVDHPKAGLLSCRVIRFAASVLSTGPVQIRANAITQSFGGYSFGDDLSDPAPGMTKTIRVSVVGRRDHPELEIIKPLPGRMQVLSLTQEVSY